MCVNELCDEFLFLFGVNRVLSGSIGVCPRDSDTSCRPLRNLWGSWQLVFLFLWRVFTTFRAEPSPGLKTEAVPRDFVEHIIFSRLLSSLLLLLLSFSSSKFQTGYCEMISLFVMERRQSDRRLARIVT